MKYQLWCYANRPFWTLWKFSKTEYDVEFDRAMAAFRTIADADIMDAAIVRADGVVIAQSRDADVSALKREAA